MRLHEIDCVFQQFEGVFNPAAEVTSACADCHSTRSNREFQVSILNFKDFSDKITQSNIKNITGLSVGRRWDASV